ncbi:pyrroloquinoline quinone biosynthesis peptide chaperone PqqD [Aquabacterium sp.]|jgi:pyrroloquinoline quinone biosynthesis protein D|uniref:pyrroloquinoline quinone biosynthesis peptide chaperone PqqD n=1 Tax=Aquabacterium sp. TaxID=1872578 RepID=UPI0025C4029F|nr:pyrroloquinoline quinone biosynthesis peptide chaperone PqqD [Aquabacterium sp.]
MSAAANLPDAWPDAVCPRVRKPFRLQWEPAQSAWVLLYPEGMVKLNGSAGEIMSRCDGERSVAALITELQTRFQLPDLGNDVRAFLHMARQQGWVDLTMPEGGVAA